MKAVIQRVNQARVSVDSKVVSSIGKGLLVYLGIGPNDQEKDQDLIVRKIIEMRLFPDGDKEGVFSVRDIDGEILLISQFTLYADIRKGRRPSFSGARPAEDARLIYEQVLEKMNSTGVITRGGVFQASMNVESENFGPYTILMDTESL